MGAAALKQKYFPPPWGTQASDVTSSLSLQHSGSMERLDLLGLLIMTLNHSMTIVGKLWLAFTILLRMAVIILAGSPIYQDEQESYLSNACER
ncbi:Gap junction delta-4 protein [Manis javanica]|nr:Gap junction delta-4 protein [Manis javanica]